jgi:hypothetical protein
VGGGQGKQLPDKERGKKREMGKGWNEDEKTGSRVVKGKI